MSGKNISQYQLTNKMSELAKKSLTFWKLSKDSTVQLINVSENFTFLVETPNHFKSILRIHRENYQTRHSISCEHAWARALNENGGVTTPGIIKGKDGNYIQSSKIDGLTSERFLVMFEFVEGKEPEQDGDLVIPFEELGEIAALTHLHSISWDRPKNFERLVWDLDTVFGSNATWGDWREAPNITEDILITLEKAQIQVIKRLKLYSKDSNRFGLIHADMRLANLLISNNTTRLIDFDDCGMGWFMYDFAAGISFMEDNVQVPALKDAWVRGYRKKRQLTPEDEFEIDTFIVMRRLALLAWIGSHREVDTAKELAPNFAKVTKSLAQAYLEKFL